MFKYVVYPSYLRESSEQVHLEGRAQLTAYGPWEAEWLYLFFPDVRHDGGDLCLGMLHALDEMCRGVPHGRVLQHDNAMQGPCSIRRLAMEVYK